MALLLANDVESAQELLVAQAHVWNHVFNYINSMSLKCAVQLGIPDAIHKHDKPMTLSQLADALPINKAKSHGLFRLMRILVHSKLFDKVVDTTTLEEAYCLTLPSRLLLKNEEPLSMATFVMATIDPIFVDPFYHLSKWFGDEHPSPFVTKNGKNMWEYGATEQSWNQLFNEAMACDARLMTRVLVQGACKQVFEGMETMVDVGGGTGTVAKGMAAAFPSMKCVVLDLPHVVAGLEGYDNLSYVAGDMFDSIPQSDAVFLKWILHDWNDEECVKILEKCREAIIGPSSNGGTGKVIIVDMVVDDEREEVETQLCYDILMMTLLTGKERSEREWEKLFFAAGFAKYKITHVLGLRSIIEVFP